MASRAATPATTLLVASAATLRIAAATLLAAPAASLAADTDPPAQSQAPAAHESPLVAYALEFAESEPGSDLKATHLATSNLRAVNFELSRHPPPRGEDCAHTLGAQRFAEQYAQLARIQDELGNFEAVIEANKAALACEPRDASYHASIADAHLSLGRVADARAAVERGNAIDPEDLDVRAVRARIDFIQERWADAIARFRLEALQRARYGDYEEYSRCYLWLAQRRAGVQKPQLPPKPSEEKPHEDTVRDQDSKRWPIPVLETLRGERTDADLVQWIRQYSMTDTREWLTEALYYVGELRLAEGDVETARRHFATVINLRVLNFVEYGMARAELARMRERSPVADAATPGTGTPPR